MHPALAPVLPNLVEALITLGRCGEARLYLERLEERGRALDSAWALSQAARSRGLIAAVEGELETALTWLEEALREHERMEGPFERGRTLLVRGAVLRRARRWRAARESLAAALAVFEEIEAPLWAAKARSELRRVGGGSAALGLTPTEQRVAHLVASRRSNPHPPPELFPPNPHRRVRPRGSTSLGVRSRTELLTTHSAQA
jgi:tetratricopeptide (TPR) repeat protein